MKSENNARQAFREFPSTMKDSVSLIFTVLLVVGAGAAIGAVTSPGDWYASLVKPSFNPPDWIFAPVWTLLYLAIAIAGWRVWRLGDRRMLRLWALQMGLNFLWSPLFFAARLPGLALIVIMALLFSIFTFVAVGWRVDRISAALFLPYAAWVGFATILNGAIVLLNPAT